MHTYETAADTPNMTARRTRRRTVQAAGALVASSLFVAFVCNGVTADAPQNLYIRAGTELYTDDKTTLPCGVTTEDANVSSIAQYSATGDTVTSFKIPDPPHTGNCPPSSWVKNFAFTD